MSDRNICEHCNCYLSTIDSYCPNCLQPMVLDSHGAVAIWRLGEIRDGILGPIARAINKEFGVRAIIQPTYLDEHPSERKGWKGISATAFLNQVLRRHQSNVI